MKTQLQKITVKTSLILFGLGVALNVQAQTNIIDNPASNPSYPSFENNGGVSGNFNGTWARLIGSNPNGNVATNMTPSNASPTAHHGTWYLRAVATPTANTGAFSDLQAVSGTNFSLTDGRQYLLTFYYQNSANHSFRAAIEPNSGSFSTGVANYNTTIGSTSSAAITTWTKANYLFTAGSNVTGQTQLRIKLQFGLNAGTTLIDSVRLIDYTTTLPVTLTSFTAKSTRSSVLLNWETASEVNSDRFEVLKSVDGNEFKLLSSVKSADKASKYAFEDKNPSSGANYYKLLQYDNDGTVTDYGVKAANFDFEITTNAVIYPNPSKSNFNIQINALKAENVKLSLIAADGKVVQTNTLNVGEGVSTHQIGFTSEIVKGNYLVRLSSDGINRVLKLIVE